MKSTTLVFILFFSVCAHAQNKLFHTYTDSASLIQDANDIIVEFTKSVNAMKMVFNSRPTAILNTKPFLIFYSPKTNQVNLPIWHQVSPEQKAFFTSMAESEKRGAELFGLFFNGFYLSHELGHALQKASGKREDDLYLNEYFANSVAILYWRKVGRTKELKQCYAFAKKMMRKLPNPVPVGEDPVNYFNEHYAELGADPYKYGYYQFAQFVTIYENKSISDFDEFIRLFLNR
jgi:hypothetical protein